MTLKILPFCILLLCMTGCITTTDFDLLNQDLSTLKRESAAAKKEIADLREKTSTQSREIDALREKTSGTVKEDSFVAIRESQADINSRLSEISSGLQDLRGRFEENKYYSEKTLKDAATEGDILKAQISALEAQVKSLKEKVGSIEERIKANELSKKPQEDVKVAEKTAEEPEQAKPPTAPQGQTAEKTDAALEKKAYDTAYQTYKKRHFREAREKFEAFMKDYPRSELTDNAQFWIAEAYYGEQDYEGAILAYETLLKKYPGSNKASSAMLKQGLAFIEIKDSKTGTTILKKLLEKFPNSKDAVLAKKKLAQLGKKSDRKK